MIALVFRRVLDKIEIQTSKAKTKQLKSILVNGILEVN